MPIPRAKGRGLLGLAEGNLLPFAGDDVWNCYELSWLNASGVPRRQTLELTIPCTTPNIVESKSLKLYLNSLNFKRFASPAAVVETITVDVGRVLGAPLRVALRDDTVEPPLLDAWRGPRPGAGLGRRGLVSTTRTLATCRRSTWTSPTRPTFGPSRLRRVRAPSSSNAS